MVHKELWLVIVTAVVFLIPNEVFACMAESCIECESDKPIALGCRGDLGAGCACGVDCREHLLGIVCCVSGATSSCPTTGDNMNGKNCYIRCGQICDWGSNGVWDASEDGCGQCNARIQTSIDFGNGNVQSRNTCESACGASPQCDEKTPDSQWCIGTYSNKCDINCVYSSKDCTPYACKESGCKLWPCSDNSDCAPGYTCCSDGTCKSSCPVSPCSSLGQSECQARSDCCWSDHWNKCYGTGEWCCHDIACASGDPLCYHCPNDALNCYQCQAGGSWVNKCEDGTVGYDSACYCQDYRSSGCGSNCRATGGTTTPTTTPPTTCVNPPDCSVQACCPGYYCEASTNPDGTNAYRCLPIPTTTTCVCSCTPWQDAGCEVSPCGYGQMKQTRSCSCCPAGTPTVQCVGSCSPWSDVGCGAGGCAAYKMYQTRSCTNNCPKQRCAEHTTCFDFSLSINPTSGAVNPGNSTNTTVSLQLTKGSTAPVSFSVSDMPPNSSYSFSPGTCNPPCESTLTIKADAGTCTGTPSAGCSSKNSKSDCEANKHCSWRSVWTMGYCTEKNCYNYGTESSCTSDPYCKWSRYYCTKKTCSDFNNKDDCKSVGCTWPTTKLGSYDILVKGTGGDPTYSATYRLSVLNCGNNLCEWPETQDNCIEDCKTIVTIQPSDVKPGQTVNLIIAFNDSRYSSNHDVRLDLTIDGQPWQTADCFINGKRWSELGWSGLSAKGWSCSAGMCKGMYQDHSIAITSLDGYGKIETTCKIPLTVASGQHVLQATPTIY